MKLSSVDSYAIRQRRKCSFCEKVRLTTPAMWQVELPNYDGFSYIEVHVCNDCLCKAD